jgi:ribosomal protein S27E
MPDLRSVTRYEGPEDRRVYYVDVRCVDCDWQDIDLIGGV